jgi:hypothetical protein
MAGFSKPWKIRLSFFQGERPLVDLVEVRPSEAVIIVGPSRRLLEIPWLRLVEIAPEEVSKAEILLVNLGKK